MSDIKTPCPACGNSTLFVGSGGHITCSWLKCPEPSLQARSTLRTALAGSATTMVAIAAQPATAGRLWAENPTLAETLCAHLAALRQHSPVDPLRSAS